jgi:hypothetical protein
VRTPRRSSAAGAGASADQSDTLRRGRSSTGVDRNDALPPRDSPATGRSRVQSVRPALHSSSSQRGE